MQKKTIVTILLFLTIFLGNAFAGTSENDFSKKANKCSSLWSAKKYTEANTCYEEMIQSYPDKATGYIGVANFLVQTEDDLGKALEYTHIAKSKVMSSKDQCDVNMTIGLAFYKLSQYSDAKEFFQKTLSLTGQCSNIKKQKEVVEAYIKKTDEMAVAKRNQEYETMGKNYKRITLGHNKGSVLALMGVEPRDKKAISTSRGVFECWSWPILGNDSVLFLKGIVVEVGMMGCPGDIFH